MKSFKKLSLIILSLILILSLLVGCSSSKNSSDNESAVTSPENISPESPSETQEFTGEKGSSIEPEKVITTITMNIETLEYEKTLDKLNQLIEANDGYVVSSQVSYDNKISARYSEYDRYAYYEIRIPKDKVSSFKKSLPDIGNITNEYTSKQDVTKYYIDTESRIKVLETKEERLLSLLERAEKIEDILAIENQLSDVISQKESLKAELQGLDERVDFTTFSISIHEVNKLSSSAGVNAGFFTKLKAAFNQAINNFYIFVEQLVLFIVSNIFFLLLVAVIIYVIVKFGIRRNKKRINYPPKNDSDNNKS